MRRLYGDALADARLDGPSHSQAPRSGVTSSPPSGPDGLMESARIWLLPYCGERGNFENAYVQADAPCGELTACLAVLKESSTQAYHRLTQELVEHRAPQVLQELARQAEAGQNEEFYTLCELAQWRGCPIGRAPLDFWQPRELFEVAEENVVQGIVRQTYCSILSMHQGERAQDLELRVVFQRACEQASVRAELAWQLHAWVISQLSPSRSRSLQRMLRWALSELDANLGELPATIREPLGLPELCVARAVLRRLLGEIEGRSLAAE